MSKHRLLVLVAVSLASAILASMAFSAPVAASTVPVSLFGSRASGWGTNATNERSPGPALSATEGDTIVVTVNSTDGRTHSWYLDYNNDSAWNTTSEPGVNFPNATGVNPVTFSFVANHTGTFHYRSSFRLDTAMWGNFTIAAAGGLLGGSNTVLIVVGVVIVIVAVLAVSAMYWQRMKGPKTPPPKS